MNQNESDPTGAFRGGAAGLEEEATTGTEYERHAPNAERRRRVVNRPESVEDRRPPEELEALVTR